MKFGMVFVMLLAAALNADPPPAKTFVFLAGSEPERISGEARLGESRVERSSGSAGLVGRRRVPASRRIPMPTKR